MLLKDRPAYQQVLAALGLVTGLTAAIVGISNASGIMEPHWIATRLFVREQTTKIKDELKGEIQAGDTKTGATLKDVLRWQIRSELATVQRERETRADRIKGHESILLRDKDMAFDARRLIEDQILTPRQQQSEADGRIAELRRELSAK